MQLHRLHQFDLIQCATPSSSLYLCRAQYIVIMSSADIMSASHRPHSMSFYGQYTTTIHLIAGGPVPRMIRNKNGSAPMTCPWPITLCDGAVVGQSVQCYHTPQTLMRIWLQWTASQLQLTLVPIASYSGPC